jgi:hypothetical protein
MLSDVEEGGGGILMSMGIAFIVLGELRLVRYLGLNLMDLLLGEGIVAINLLFYYW